MSTTGAARLQRGNSLGFGETPDRVTFNPAQAPLADREVLRRVSCSSQRLKDWLSRGMPLFCANKQPAMLGGLSRPWPLRLRSQC